MRTRSCNRAYADVIQGIGAVLISPSALALAAATPLAKRVVGTVRPPEPRGMR